MYSSGFQLIINTAWNMLNITILPAGSFGDHGNITFLNILLLGLGALFTVKFLRFCMGGNFNNAFDKIKVNRRPPEDPRDINTFMKDPEGTNKMINFMNDYIKNGYKVK